MININILDENYIPFQSKIAENENKINSDLTDLMEQIMIESDKSGLEFKYSPLVEELTSYDYKGELAKFVRNLKESLSLEESILFSRICKDVALTESTDINYATITEGFGSVLNSSMSNDLSNVNFSKEGKLQAIRNVSRLQEEVSIALSNINKSENLVESLYVLGEVKYLLTK